LGVGDGGQEEALGTVSCERQAVSSERMRCASPWVSSLTI